MTALGATRTVSNTDPASIAVATSQSVPNARMQAVLDQLAALSVKPIKTLSVVQARTQPRPADAVKALLVKVGKSTASEPVGSVVDITFAGPAALVPVTICTPAGTGPFPVALHIHGCGWIIGSRQAYDSSARTLTDTAGAVIVSTGYRLAPENEFAAAHDDTFAAFCVAVVGESGGGNMAASIGIWARAQGVPLPLCQVLIYPVTNYAFATVITAI